MLRTSRHGFLALARRAAPSRSVATHLLCHVGWASGRLCQRSKFNICGRNSRTVRRREKSLRRAEDEDGSDALPDEALHVLAHLTRVINIFGVEFAEMPDGGDDWANTAGAFPQGRDDQVDSAGFEVIAGRGGSARSTFDARRTTSTSGSFLPWRVNYSNWFEMINAVRYDAFDLDGEAVSHAGNRISPSTTGNRS